MGASSWIHWVVLGLIVLLLFGKGRFSAMMGDVASGIKNFKKGMAEDDQAAAPPMKQIDGQRAPDPAPTQTPTQTTNDRDPA